MNMVTVDEAIIAKYDKDGRHFEILVDSNLAYDFKAGKSVSIQKMLAVNDVYIDSKKGQKASNDDIKTVFGTDDIEEITEIMIKKGVIQLTTEFRKKKTEEKRLQIASIISKNAVNPQTKLPHPQDRIENAMNQARINIDPFVPADQQLNDIIDAIKLILPISIEQAELEIMIPAKYAAKIFGMLKNIGEVSKQEWLNDGSLTAVLKMPAGMKQDVYEKLNSLTEGNVVIKE